jgi:hypothetical protein
MPEDIKQEKVSEEKIDEVLSKETTHFPKPPNKASADSRPWYLLPALHRREQNPSKAEISSHSSPSSPSEFSAKGDKLSIIQKITRLSSFPIFLTASLLIILFITSTLIALQTPLSLLPLLQQDISFLIGKHIEIPSSVSVSSILPTGSNHQHKSSPRELK